MGSTHGGTTHANENGSNKLTPHQKAVLAHVDAEIDRLSSAGRPGRFLKSMKVLGMEEVRPIRGMFYQVR